MPVAKARSSFGNQSATVLMAAGKFDDSPSQGQTAPPQTAKACWQASAAWKRAPHRYRECVANPRAQPFHRTPGKRHHQGVRKLKREDDPAVVGVIPAQLFSRTGFRIPSTWRST